MQSTTVETSRPNIIDRIAAFIEQYVFLPDTCLYRLLALWVVATYLHQEFGHMGYVFAYSATPQSGKSRLLEVLNLLVYQPSGIIVSPTEAVLFRTASGQTQLIDEADSCGHLDSLRSVLNAGFQRGGNVKRMERGADGSYQTVEFPVYGPRVLAGIGRRILDATTLDRTFSIQMSRQKKSERGQRFRLKSATKEAEALRKEIEQWVSENKATVQARYESEFAYLEDFRDRTIDVAEPLAAILEVAFAKGTQKAIEKARRDLLEAISLTRKEESVTFDSSVLVALAKLAKEETLWLRRHPSWQRCSKTRLKMLTSTTLLLYCENTSLKPRACARMGLNLATATHCRIRL